MSCWPNADRTPFPSKDTVEDGPQQGGETEDQLGDWLTSLSDPETKSTPSHRDPKPKYNNHSNGGGKGPH